MTSPLHLDPYRQPKPTSRGQKIAMGCGIAALVALAIPTVMLFALFIFIVGVCGHFR